MPIDAIGSTLGGGVANLSTTSLNQEDFLRLFLTELNFQDPLEPINNREFLAQIAQFAGLEQNRQTTESVDNLVFLNSTTQSVGLLGRTVEISSASGIASGTVSAVRFSADGAALTVNLTNGIVLTDVRLSQINMVR